MKKTKALILSAVALALVSCGTANNPKTSEISIESESSLENVEMNNSYRVYPKTEIAKNSTLESVSLYYFPASGSYMSQDNYGKRNKVALVCPGGGYTMVATAQEGKATCEGLNKEGYTAFYLSYRCGREYKGEDFMPMKDLYQAISYLASNEDKFGIDMSSYLMFGYSAGAHLVATTMTGAMKYAVNANPNLPMPKGIMLGYPWLQIEETSPALTFLTNNSKTLNQVLCPFDFIESDYPDTFIWASSGDTDVDKTKNADVMVEKLKENGIRYQYNEYTTIDHGTCLSIGTEAEGWLQEALEFFK